MTMRKTLTTALIAVLLAMIPGAIAAVRAQAPSGPREGIVVHGHWVIDVREPDGRLVSHREFENALQSGGAAAITDILARRKTAGYWAVTLGNTAGPYLCPDGPCKSVEPGMTSGPGLFPNLIVGATGLVLSGTITATTSGNIDSVSTAFFQCASSSLVAACASGTGTVVSGGIFSATTLTPVQVVAAGQIVQVTVTFTFS